MDVSWSWADPAKFWKLIENDLGTDMIHSIHTQWMSLLVARSLWSVAFNTEAFFFQAQCDSDSYWAEEGGKVFAIGGHWVMT